MADRIYVGQEGVDIIIDAGEDLSGVTNPVYKVRKPVSGDDGTEWTPTISGTEFRYTTGVDDLDEPGVYFVQVYGEEGAWKGYWTTIQFKVYPRWR